LAHLVQRGRLRTTLAVISILLALLYTAGEFVQPPPISPTNAAVLVQQNLPLDIKWSSQIFDETMGKLSALSRQAAKKDDPAPRLIIWPESPGPFFVTDPKFRAWMSTLAQDRDAFIIAGSLGTPEGQMHPEEIYNSAALVAPSGQFVSRYDKLHLVPFGEYVPFQKLLFFAKNLTKEVGTFSAGTDRKVFAITQGEAKGQGVAKGKIGVFICYESVFPDEIREFAANGAEVFVNISNDGWFGDTGAGRQHLNMARMRAMENHRWLLRATNTGITASIDPYGRIMADAERNKQTVLRAPYSYISGTTFYTRHGDWFAWACAIISFVMVFSRFNLRVGVIR
jgi:apolipoprotein N-acyltransferase